MSTPHDPSQPYPMFQPAPPEVKSSGTAWLLFLFLGGFSAHRFYLGQTSRALLQLFTLQYLTVAIWIDLFTLNREVRKVNASNWEAYQRALAAVADEA